MRHTKKKLGTVCAAFLLSGCGGTSLEIPVVEPGWDIYTGGVYRYGPSIIVEKDGSIDAWFAAPGGYHDAKNLKYDDNTPVRAIELNKGAVAAQRFSEAQPFYALRVVCPNNGGKEASLTLSLYRWDTDYKSTLRHNPVATQRFDKYTDNQSLELVNPDKFPYGEYLWTLSEGTNNDCMVWLAEGNVEGVTNYLNGEEIEGSYKARVSQEVSDGTFF